jgi:DNA-binding beta-propeller fold protein YncE
MDRRIRRFGLGRAFEVCRCQRWFLALGFGMAGALSMAPAQATLCGGVLYPFPYTDVSGVGAPFCPGIMEAYVTGVTKGTTPTTFSPNDNVIRLQMTTFLQRSLDQGLARAGRRAALKQWWSARSSSATQAIALTGNALFCASDGEYIWTTTTAGHVAQIHASTGVNVNHWTGVTNPGGVLVAAGQVFTVGSFLIGNLYMIDPTQPPGPATAIAALPAGSSGIAFDGTNVWTANTSGSVSIVLPITPFTVNSVTTGFTTPVGIVYDGAHIWVTDSGAGKLFELDAMGNILGSGVTVGTTPEYPVFDGANIWVPNRGDNSITVVQASTGAIVATITQTPQNRLSLPTEASFDGERVLVTNAGNSSVTVFKAADLSLIGNTVFTDASPSGACSDGINFWVEAVDLFRI